MRAVVGNVCLYLVHGKYITLTGHQRKCVSLTSAESVVLLTHFDHQQLSKVPFTVHEVHSMCSPCATSNAKH